MRPIWLVNIKDWMTGTTVGAKNGLDVNVINSSVPIALSSYAYKERRVHLASATTIPASASSMIELDVLSGTTGAADIANTIAQMDLNWNGSGILEFGVGANAGAAAAAIIASIGSGQTRSFGVSLTSGNKIWVRAVKNVALTSGELVAVFSG